MPKPKHEDIDLRQWVNPDVPAWTTLEADSKLIVEQAKGEWFLRVKTNAGFDTFRITLAPGDTDKFLQQVRGKKHLGLRVVTYK